MGQLAAAGTRTCAGSARLAQREVLLIHAQHHSIPAAYAFYNDIASARAFTRSCPWELVFGPLGGIALAGAQDIDLLVRQCGPVGTYVPATLLGAAARPLSCALLCHEGHQPGDDDIDVIVRTAIDARAESFGVQQGSTTSEDVQRMVEVLFAQDIEGRGNEDDAIVQDVLGTLNIQGIALVSQDHE